MASAKKNDVISEAPPHSIKKFELISEYVKAWIQILMQNTKCKGIVYIDCMSNSGVYKTDKGEEIEGTPLRVSNIIAEAMQTYPYKQAYLYFNDWNDAKIDLLTTRLPKQTNNFHIYTEAMDANTMLRQIGNEIASNFKDMHCNCWSISMRAKWIVFILIHPIILVRRIGNIIMIMWMEQMHIDTASGCR